MSSIMLNRFVEIVPSCLELDDVIMREDIIRLCRIAFSIVGYDAKHLSVCVDTIVENPMDFGIDFLKKSVIENPKNQRSLESISLGSLSDLPQNLGKLFYEIWRLDE